MGRDINYDASEAIDLPDPKKLSFPNPIIFHGEE